MICDFLDLDKSYSFLCCQQGSAWPPGGPRECPELLWVELPTPHRPRGHPSCWSPLTRLGSAVLTLKVFGAPKWSFDSLAFSLFPGLRAYVSLWLGAWAAQRCPATFFPGQDTVLHAPCWGARPF